MVRLRVDAKQQQTRLLQEREWEFRLCCADVENQGSRTQAVELLEGPIEGLIQDQELDTWTAFQGGAHAVQDY